MPASPSRRTVLHAAWSVPAVTAITAAPAFAASGGPSGIARVSPTAAGSGFVEVFDATSTGTTYAIRATDAAGDPLPGATITFTLNRTRGWAGATLDGSGTALTTTATTNATGVATVTVAWATVPTVLDQLTLTATATGPSGALTPVAWRLRYRAFTKIFDNGGSATTAFALLADRVVAWGKNDTADYGDGTTTVQDAPVLALKDMPRPVVAVSGSNYPLKNQFTRSWSASASGGAFVHGGYIQAAQVGSLTPVRDSTVTLTASDPAGVQVATTYGVTCYLVDGVAYTRGSNAVYALGQGSTDFTITSPTPAAIARGAMPTGAKITALTGRQHLNTTDPQASQIAFFVIADGKAYAWGHNGTQSAASILGRGLGGSNVALSASNSAAAPVALATGSGANDLPANATVTRIACATTGAGVLIAGGNAYGWGTSGNGTSGVQLRPFKIAATWGGGALVEVSGGYNHFLGLDAAGTLWAWGTNTGGQLGNGIITPSVTPVTADLFNARTASSGARIIGIRAGYACSFVLYDDGTLWAVGTRGSSNTSTAANEGPGIRRLGDNSTATAVQSSAIVQVSTANLTGA